MNQLLKKKYDDNLKRAIAEFPFYMQANRLPEWVDRMEFIDETVKASLKESLIKDYNEFCEKTEKVSKTSSKI